MNLLNSIMPKEIEVKRFANDYSRNELGEIQTSFKPVAEMIRRRQKKSNFIVLVIVFALLISIVFPKYFSVVLDSRMAEGLFFIGLIIGSFLLLLKYRTPPLVCPACKNGLTSLNKFCPECGSQLLTVRRFLQDVPRCESCNKDMLIRKGKRYFKIKFCTFCAVKLDDQGI